MNRIFRLFFSLILATIPAFAQKSSTSIPNAQQPPGDSSVQALDKVTTDRRGFKITYFGDVEGPSVKDPQGTTLFDDESLERTKDRTGWYHEPGIDYRLRQGLSLKVKFPFTVRFSRDEKNENFEPDDISVGLANSGLIRTDNFNLYFGVSGSAATVEYSRSRQRLGEVGATIIPSYEFGTSGFKLEWVSLFKKYIYVPSSQFSSSTQSKVDRFTLSEVKAEFYPALLYAVGDKASLVFGGHLLFMHNRGQQDFTFTQLEDRAHVGLNYKFSQALTLRPEIRFKNPSNIVAENTEAGMLIFGTIQ